MGTLRRAVLGTLSGSTTLNRHAARALPTRGRSRVSSSRGDPMGFVRLGQIKLGAVDVQGDIPTPEDAEKDLAAADAAVRKNRL